MANLERHVDNVLDQYGLPCVVAVNHFTHDTSAEFALVEERLRARGVNVVSARHWADGGAGAETLARAVVDLADRANDRFHYVYEDTLPLWDKLVAVATKIYGAAASPRMPR